MNDIGLIGLSLGQSPEEIQRVLGAPQSKNGNQWIYQFDSSSSAELQPNSPPPARAGQKRKNQFVYSLSLTVGFDSKKHANSISVSFSAEPTEF
jgi:hypothetical protein